MKRPSLFLSLPWSRRTPPRLAFEQQRRRAANRGIAWLLSFEQWWSIWTTSGKFAERGRGRGYCMARRGDIGPYGVENVYICTIAENSSESLRVKPNALRRPPGRGWSYRPDKSKTNPYRVRYRNIDIGLFPTPEEAQLAYVRARDDYRRSVFGGAAK